MFTKIKRFMAVIVFSLFATNSFAIDVVEDLGLISSSGMTLFDGISLNDDALFNGQWTFELAGDSYVDVIIDDFNIPSLFSELELIMVVDGNFQSPTYFSDLLSAGIHSINIYAPVLVGAPLNGIYGSIGVIPAVPELSTYAMLFLGMGFVGFVNRKKKQ